jgi:hypothetical protein
MIITMKKSRMITQTALKNYYGQIGHIDIRNTNNLSSIINKLNVNNLMS